MREELCTRLLFKVIVSEEEQYSLWLLDREDPPGWHDTGWVRASAKECLAYIKEIYFREGQHTAKPAVSSTTQAKPAQRAVYA